tara:strand:- start:205 stop:516 length:312 start_codon:yes stop_codon:yes gene_type:complete
MSHNGWTNYATWRVNLEMIDGNHDLAGWDADQLQEWVAEIIDEQSEGDARGYAHAFLNDVNWYEIADHLREEYGLCKGCNETTTEDYCPECENENKYSHYEKL